MAARAGRRLLLSALASACLGEATHYTITSDSFGEGAEAVKLKVLRNTITGEYLEVAWNLGGRTEALVLASPQTGGLRNVLLSSERNASDVRANTGWKGDMLIPYANRIKNGTYSLPGGGTYYLDRNEDRSPYGREALHGYLYNKEMRVLEQTVTNSAAVLTLAYDFHGEDPGYPFPLSVKLTYTLDASGLTLKTWAYNRGDSAALPFHSSWHSYFAVSDVSKAIVQFDSCSDWNHIQVSNNSNLESDMIPTGATVPVKKLPGYTFDGSRPVGGTREEPTYWDDEFKAAASTARCRQLQTRIIDSESREASVLWMDSNFRWLQVFTGAPKTFGKQAIAVEAMSSQCDAWNNLQGMRLLQAGEEWSGETGVYLEEASSGGPALVV